MNRQVDVSLIDSLRRFQASLQGYGETVQDIVAVMQHEVHRAVEWFEQDRTSYWPAEVRKASNRLNEAKNQLAMKQLKIDGSHSPSCYEEKKAVEVARNRLRYAEDRIQKTRHWLRVVKQEVDEFRGLLSKMQSLSDYDIPKAAASLNRMAEALDKYAKQRSVSQGDKAARVRSDSSAKQPNNLKEG